MGAICSASIACASLRSYSSCSRCGLREITTVGQGRWPYFGEVIYQTLSLATWASIPTLIIALFPYRWLRKVLQGLTIFAYSYLLLFESFLVFSYSSLYTDSIALNILATNPGERLSLLGEPQL